MSRNDFDNKATVRDVITKLLLVALPAELRASAPDLVARVAEHPDVGPHLHKLWAQLSEGQSNKVAREVDLVARDVICGAGDLSASGEHLH
jgi:ABC-type glutathione transport system ATPase component